MKIGIISPNDFRPWCTKANWKSINEKEDALKDALSKRGYQVILARDAKYNKEYPGLYYFSDEVVGIVQKKDLGKKLKGIDMTAWRTGLVRTQIDHLVKEGVDCIVIHQGDWTWPQRTSEIITALSLYDKEPKLVMFSYKDTKVPGLVAGMAAVGAALRLGVKIGHAFGKPENKEDIDWLCNLIKKDETSLNNDSIDNNFSKKVNAFEEKAEEIVNKELPKQKYLALGTTGCLDMDTTEADPVQWRKIFRVGVKQLDQTAVDDIADKLVIWKGLPGESDYEIKDQRVKDAVNAAFKHFKFIEKNNDALKKRMILQIASYYAMLDLFNYHEATFGGIKCQDEESARRCTQCIGAAFLNNDKDITKKAKQIIPFACENDMDQSLTQLIMYLISGKPAGFGDFRDVEYETNFKDGMARLAIVNCGQHPPYYFDSEVEACTQEHFYAKPGSSVRGRTPKGKIMTVARLARFDGKYQLIATVIETDEVKPSDHEKYNLSWPIIIGKLPKGLTGKEMISMWPSNHLGFTEGDITAELAAVAEELNIGYNIVDARGNVNQKMRLS